MLPVTRGVSILMRAEEAMQIGPLELKLRVCRASWNGTDVGLTLTEYKIVHLLVTNLGNHLTYRAVYDTMHHAGFIAGSTWAAYGGLRDTPKA